MIFFEIKKIKGSLIWGIVISTMLAVACGKVKLSASLISTQFNFSELFLKLDIRGALHWSCVSAIFTLMFMDMFDSIGTLVACANRAKLVDEKGQIRDLDRLLALNAGATMLGALFGTSTITAYVESAAGIEQGGRGIGLGGHGRLFSVRDFFNSIDCHGAALCHGAGSYHGRIFHDPGSSAY